jgi:parallel beta-helix repeat protein
VHNNKVEASANQANLAANSIQFGFGSSGIIKSNQVAGNQWCANASADATGILIFDSHNINVTQNIFTGNADVGIYIQGNNNTINNNKVTDDGSIADCNQIPDDIGIYNDLTNVGSVLTNNKVGGFDTPYLNVVTGNNKTNPNK